MSVVNLARALRLSFTSSIRQRQLTYLTTLRTHPLAHTSYVFLLSSQLVCVGSFAEMLAHVVVIVICRALNLKLTLLQIYKPTA